MNVHNPDLSNIIGTDSGATYVNFTEATAKEFQRVSDLRSVTLSGVPYRIYTEPAVLDGSIAEPVAPPEYSAWGSKAEDVSTGDDKSSEDDHKSNEEDHADGLDPPTALLKETGDAATQGGEPDSNGNSNSNEEPACRSLESDNVTPAINPDTQLIIDTLRAENNGLRYDLDKAHKEYRSNAEAMQQLYEGERALRHNYEGKCSVYKGLMVDFASELAELKATSMKSFHSLEVTTQSLLCRAMLGEWCLILQLQLAHRLMFMMTEDFITEKLKHPSKHKQEDDVAPYEYRGNRSKLFCQCSHCKKVFDKLANIIKSEYKLVTNVTVENIRRALGQSYVMWSQIAHPSEKKPINLKMMGDMEYVVYGLSKLQNWPVQK